MVFWTKDPDIGRPAQVNEATLQGISHVEPSPVHLRGAFLVLAHLSGDRRIPALSPEGGLWQRLQRFQQ